MFSIENYLSSSNIFISGFQLISQCRGQVSRLQLMAAPVIDGVRMPDDARDLIVFRNGKFIRNSFIPGDSTVSIKLDEPKKMSVSFYAE